MQKVVGDELSNEINECKLRTWCIVYLLVNGVLGFAFLEIPQRLG